MTAWINGHEAAAVDYRDRGFNYGDGVFESMRVRCGVVRLLDYHLERLGEACRRLAFFPPNGARLRRELAGIAAPRRDAVLKLVVTRGVGARGYRPSGRERCTRVISVHPWSKSMRQATLHPVRVRLCDMRLGTNATLSGLKTLNRLESVLARGEWSDARVWEGLLRDGEDHLVCGTMSNLFIRRGALLITPKLDRCGVAGVMRRWVLEQAGALNLDAREDRLRWNDLHRADEAFMTNAVAGIVPVAEIHNRDSKVRWREHGTAEHLRRRLEPQ